MEVIVNYHKTNTGLLKQIFWKLHKEKGIDVDITKANIFSDNKEIAFVDFDEFGVLFYKERKEISIISK